MRARIEADIVAAIGAKGPKLGKELHEMFPDVEYLALWQACFMSNILQISQFSRYYLRYDITRTDMIRLSPSILRDFLSFTIVSLPHQRDTVVERLVRLSNAHREISMWKMSIARNILTDVMEDLERDDHGRICAFLAGDLTYFLGHNEPREVEAVGRMVKGSDIDIVIVHDGLPPDTVAAIDTHILAAKNYYLRHPDFAQEVDYVVKDTRKMYGQFAYDTIKQKIASKIVYESLFLAGAVSLYGDILDRLKTSGTADRIEADFEAGLNDRAAAVRALRDTDPDAAGPKSKSLFYFSQERVEFE